MLPPNILKIGNSVDGFLNNTLAIFNVPVLPFQGGGAAVVQNWVSFHCFNSSFSRRHFSSFISTHETYHDRHNNISWQMFPGVKKSVMKFVLNF